MRRKPVRPQVGKAARELLVLGYLLFWQSFMLALLVLLHFKYEALPGDARFLARLVPWGAVWLASAIGNTLNQGWGVAYHAFVKHDYKADMRIFRSMEIVHAGFVTTLIFGLGYLILPQAVLPEPASPMGGLPLAFAALLGYFNRHAFKLLYDGFLKVLKIQPGAQVDPENVVEGSDVPLAALMAESLHLGDALLPAAKGDAKADLRHAIERLAMHDIRYTHELAAAVPDDGAVTNIATDLPEAEANALKALARFSRLLAIVPDVPLAQQMYRGLQGDGDFSTNAGLQWLKGKVPPGAPDAVLPLAASEPVPHAAFAYDYARIVLGLKEADEAPAPGDGTGGHRNPGDTTPATYGDVVF